MVYITNGVTTYIPRTNQTAGIKAFFENQTTHELFQNFVTGYSEYYYTYFPTVDMPDGQYSYKVVDIYNQTIESGVAQAGNFVPRIEQYPMEKITYTTYKYD